MQESGNQSTMIQNRNIREEYSSLMFYALILLVVSMPLSEFGMSVSQFLLLFFWAYEGSEQYKSKAKENKLLHFFSTLGKNLARKFKLIFKSKPLLIFLIIYLLHVIGLFYSDDLHYALKDLRVKLPLLSLPIIFATSRPLDLKRFKILILLLAGAVLTGTMVSLYVLLTQNITDTREISVFISHIRFSLLICMVIFSLIHLVATKEYSGKINIVMIFVIIWLSAFLFLLKSLTGIVIAVALSGMLSVRYILKNKRLIAPAFIIIVLLIVGGWYYFKGVYNDIVIVETVDISKLDKETKYGNQYTHDTISFGIEDGKYVGLYLSIDELREAWNKRSELDFDGRDNDGQELKYTLVRFLNSKGLRKDADGVEKLNAEEIHYIENGIANINYLNSFSIRAKLEQLIKESKAYIKEDNPNGSSFMQRLEYWKTSLYLINKEPIFGIGTGDVNNAFLQAYDKTESKLYSQYRLRSHNQFLAIAVAFGVFGLLVFIFSLVYPPLMYRKFSNYYFLLFFLIAIISFLTEDTLETQAGCTFFAFFYSILVFGLHDINKVNKSAEVENMQ